jgi:ABC-type multidrug transport system ATPase subunit
VQGRVLVDGTKLDSDRFKKVVKYVQQEDILTAVLTVEETLVYSASFYTTDLAVQRRRADEAIALLGLERQRKTPVGNVILRGLSGGQRRRLSVGNELVAAPGILLLDELTSGLDSTAANSVMTSMQKVCRERHTTMAGAYTRSLRSSS